MSLEENKAIVRRFIEEGCNQGKLEAFDETVAADCPWGEDAQGPEAFKKWCVMQRAWSPDLHVTIDGVIAEGDQVVVSQTAAGTETGEREGQPPPTRKEWNIQIMWIFTLTEGKISRIKTLQDSFALYSQLGLMPQEENKAIVRRLIEEAWQKADLDALAEIMSVDCILHDSEENGLEAYKQGVIDNHAAFPDWQYTIVDIVAESDKVVCRTRGKGTQTGDWGGLPPTNKQVEWGVWTACRIADGKIAEVWQIATGFWMHVQLGTIPTFEEIVKQAQAKQA